MTNLQLTEFKLNPDPYWRNPISWDQIPRAHWVSLFDQNGYDLTTIEIEYSKVNGHAHSEHRNYTHVALKSPWFTQPCTHTGAVLNHALLFERKAYAGEALEQLTTWAARMPLLYKVIQIRAKWGLDFSLDWVDTEGNVFELFHYEFDSFDYEEIANLKPQLEQKFLHMDWPAAAQELIRRKAEWHHLGFFEQSDYKCAFFGLPSERFKMVTWA